MTRSHMSAGRHERGAVLVHVAVVMVGLAAFGALAIDYGVLWMSRRQAQNAADAAALAGAESLAFDDPNDFDRARAVAKTVGEATPNKIFDATAAITQGSGNSPDITQDISFPTDTVNCPLTGGAPDTCVRVNVYRNTGNNPLPTFFARLVGIDSQGVRATATAQMFSGNATECLKPWAVADRWQEHVKRNCKNQSCSQFTWAANANPWTTADTFDRFAKNNGTWAIDSTITAQGFTPDEYVPPTLDDNGYPVAGSGSGFKLYNADGTYADYGTVLGLHIGSNNTNDPVSSGWFQALDLPCVVEGCPTNSGADKYKYNIKYCSGFEAGIGDTINVQTGVSTGPTSQAVYDEVGQLSDSLVERDPGAYWDTTTQSIRGGCMEAGTCVTSPRIVPVALFDVQTYLATNPSGNGGSVTITNIMGFFILSQAQAAQLGFAVGNGNTGAEVAGVIVAAPGLLRGSSTQPITSSFLRQVVLVR